MYHCAPCFLILLPLFPLPTGESSLSPAPVGFDFRTFILFKKRASWRLWQTGSLYPIKLLRRGNTGENKKWRSWRTNFMATKLVKVYPRERESLLNEWIAEVANTTLLISDIYFCCDFNNGSHGRGWIFSSQNLAIIAKITKNYKTTLKQKNLFSSLDIAWQFAQNAAFIHNSITTYNMIVLDPIFGHARTLMNNQTHPKKKWNHAWANYIFAID